MITFKIEQTNAEKPQDFQSQHARFKVLKPTTSYFYPEPQTPKHPHQHSSLIC